VPLLFLIAFPFPSSKKSRTLSLLGERREFMKNLSAQKLSSARICNMKLVVSGGQTPGTERRTKLISDAHEFAELKKQCEDILPYNAHKATLLSDRYVEPRSWVFS